jgi:phage repressor protein C with HTH and peptisase S24 domain
MFGWWPLLVHGPSMAPTLRSGDALLAHRRASVRAGDIVVASFPSRPDIGLVVKRADHREDGDWWVVGDNELAIGDSRTYGAAVVHARVVARYWPRPRLFR